MLIAGNVYLVHQSTEVKEANTGMRSSDDSDNIEVDKFSRYGKYGLKNWEQSDDEEYSPEFGDLETAAMGGAKSDIQDSEEEDAEEEDKSNSKALSGSDEQKELEKEEEDKDLLRALAAPEVACQNIIKYEGDITVTGSE